MAYTIWLTGLPCSGKTTLAKGIELKLKKSSFQAIHLDGDDLRKGLNSDLGFSKKDREENLRRVANLAQLLNKKNYRVIASFISPTEEHRKMIKEIISNVKFVYVKCSLEGCKKRDVKGMYKKAELGIIKDFTGISDAFEEPKNPESVVDTEKHNIEKCVNKIFEDLSLP